jgi:catechol 2,3-dioxygenase-like lactoylglutathione lyase family enzyme
LVGNFAERKEPVRKGGGTMKLEGLNYVMIGVRDMDKALEWFSNVFGVAFEEWDTEKLGTRLCINQDVGVELMSPLDPLPETALPEIKRLAKKLEGKESVLLRVAFRVKDAEAAAFNEKGLPIERKLEFENFDPNINYKELFPQEEDGVGTQVVFKKLDPLPIKNVKNIFPREEDTLGIDMLFLEYEEA